MADTDIKDFDPDTPSNNITVMGVSIAQGGTQTAQIDDAVRRILSVVASGDFGTYPVKADTISESTADAGVTIDGLLIKDGVAVGNLPSNSLGYIAGLVPSQAADTDHDTTVSAGAAATDDNTAVMALAAAITKRLDAAWAVGTNQGGLDTGTVTLNSWYFLWLIERSDTDVQDVLYSLSATAPNMAAGDLPNYDRKRLIGEVLTDASANIIAYKAYETAGGAVRYVWDIYAALANVSDPGILAVTPTLSVPGPILPEAHIRVMLVSRTAISNLILTETTQSDISPTGPTRTLTSDADSERSMISVHIRADASSQVRYRLDASSGTVSVEIGTIGWLDPRR